MSLVSIELVLEGAATVACFPVMRQLRLDLSEDEFLQRVARQRPQGYQLLAASVDGEVVAVAGFRVLDNLAWGRFLYVDDLVTVILAGGTADAQADINDDGVVNVDDLVGVILAWGSC